MGGGGEGGNYCQNEVKMFSVSDQIKFCKDLEGGEAEPKKVVLHVYKHPKYQYNAAVYKYRRKKTNRQKNNRKLL